VAAALETIRRGQEVGQTEAFLEKRKADFQGR
jgi:hypothetical protein